MAETRREMLRRIVQAGAAEEGEELTEAEEHAAMELLERIIPADAEIYDGKTGERAVD